MVSLSGISQEEIIRSLGYDPEVNKKKEFKVLLADSVTDRALKFKVTGGDSNVKYVRHMDAMRQAMETEPWDLVFFNIFLAGWVQGVDYLPMFVDAHAKGNVGGIIIVSPVKFDAQMYVKRMLLAGIPAGWIHTKDGELVKTLTKVEV